jgi:hypothetical protein
MSISVFSVRLSDISLCCESDGMYATLLSERFLIENRKISDGRYRVLDNRDCVG